MRFGRPETRSGRSWLLGHDLKAQASLSQALLFDPEMAAQCSFVAFNIEKSAIVGFELPLHQEVRVVTTASSVNKT